MKVDFGFLIIVAGVVLIFEGMPWFLSPQGAKRVLAQLLLMNDRSLRTLGLILMLTGLFMVYLVRGQF